MTNQVLKDEIVRLFRSRAKTSLYGPNRRERSLEKILEDEKKDILSDIDTVLSLEISKIIDKMAKVDLDN